MPIDGVKCSKLTHLKHFTLNAAKNFINTSQTLVGSTEVWRGKNHFGRGIALLALSKICQ